MDLNARTHGRASWGLGFTGPFAGLPEAIAIIIIALASLSLSLRPDGPAELQLQGQVHVCTCNLCDHVATTTEDHSGFVVVLCG
jgi:hypothetical protein